MFAPIATQDLSWPDPQFGGPDAILKWLGCSQAYANIPLSTTDDVITVGPNYGTARYKWVGSAIAKNGLICACPQTNTNKLLFIDTNNDYVVSSSYAVSPNADAQLNGVIYCSYDDSFYMSGRPNVGVNGLVKVNASDTSSFSTGSILPNTPLAPGMYVDQDTIYLREWLGLSTPQKLFTYNVKTGVTASIANISSSGFGAEQTLLAPNNIMFFPNNEGNLFQYYDFNTGTTGSCSGRADADNLTQFVLMPDGNYYAVPGFRGDKVYKLDPNTKTLSVVYTGSPYVSGLAQRDRWLAWFPNNTIANLEQTTPFDVIAYNYSNNTAASVNFTIPTGGGGDYAYGSSVLAPNATYAIPADETTVVKFNRVSFRNLLNGATFSSPINTNL
jgi:hypothetical protein